MPGFFGLSSSNDPNLYRFVREKNVHLLDEIYFLIKALGMSYEEVWNMPNSMRRYIINKEIELIEKKIEQQNEISRRSKHG